MPRPASSPQTCEGTQRLELAYLRRAGLLEPGVRSHTLNWRSNGKPSGSIGIEVHMTPDETYLCLHYTVNGTDKYDYRVELVPAPSNLPGVDARRYYLVCPKTHRRATVLYLRTGTGTGIFAHRRP